VSEAHVTVPGVAPEHHLGEKVMLGELSPARWCMGLA
jgi:hypothetical protein